MWAGKDGLEPEPKANNLQPSGPWIRGSFKARTPGLTTQKQPEGEAQSSAPLRSQP